MEITVSGSPQSTQFKLVGKIDEEGANQLKSAFMKLDHAKLEKLQLDFGGVTFIGSAGMGKLLLFYKRTAEHKGTIEAINLSPDMMEMFRLLKLDNLFSLYGS